FPEASPHPVKDFRGAEASILTVPMRPVGLIILVGNPALVDRFSLLPAGHLREVIIGQTALQVELGLNKIFPRLLLVDLFFANRERVVDNLSLLGLDYIGWIPFSRLNTCVEQE